MLQQCSARSGQTEGMSVFVMTANGEPVEFEGRTLVFGDSVECDRSPE